MTTASETDVILAPNTQKTFDDYAENHVTHFTVESDKKEIVFDLNHFQHPTKDETLPIILFIHGFGEHVGAFHEYIYRLHHYEDSEKGQPLKCDFMVYDQRSHGVKHAKPDKVVSMDFVKNAGDICTLAEFVRNEFPSRQLFLHGNSMGGATILFTAFNMETRFMNLKLSGVIFENPLVQTHSNQANWFLKLVVQFLGHWVPNWLVPTEIDTKSITHDQNIAKRIVEDPWFQYKSNFGTAKAILDSANWIHENLNLWPASVPFCLNISTGDKIVCPISGEKLFTVNGKKHGKNVLNKYQGAFHALKNETDDFCYTFVGNVQNFISEF